MDIHELHRELDVPNGGILTHAEDFTMFRGSAAPSLDARDKQIRKLERLVWDAIYALQKAGLDSVASKLRRAVED